LQESSQGGQETAGTYIAGMQEQFNQLLPSPARRQFPPAILNSVLVALSTLEEGTVRLPLGLSFIATPTTCPMISAS